MPLQNWSAAVVLATLALMSHEFSQASKRTTRRAPFVVNVGSQLGQDAWLKLHGLLQAGKGRHTTVHQNKVLWEPSSVLIHGRVEPQQQPSKERRRSKTQHSVLT